MIQGSISLAASPSDKCAKTDTEMFGNMDKVFRRILADKRLSLISFAFTVFDIRAFETVLAIST